MNHNRERPTRILTAGYLTLDLISRNVAANEFWQSVGGTCGNVSVFASALGADVSLLARTGGDHRGQLLMRKVAAAGVHTAGVEQVSALNTPGIVEIIRGTPDGQHRFTHRCPLCGVRLPKEAVVSKRRAEIEADQIGKFDTYFFDRATPATLHLAKAAREAGLLVMFEPPSFPRTRGAQHAAEVSDIVKVSHKPGHQDLNWELVQNSSAKLVIETLGASGVRFSQRSKRGWGEWREVPPPSPPQIRDTAGAGDWLTAGLLTRLLPKGDLCSLDPTIASIEYGQRLSAISISFDGPSGALHALGAAEIARAANGSGPIEDFWASRRLKSRRSSFTGNQSAYCELCLTEGLGNGI